MVLFYFTSNRKVASYLAMTTSNELSVSNVIHILSFWRQKVGTQDDTLQ